MEALVPWLIGGATVVKAVGAIQSGAAAQDAANFNAAILNQNATVARQQADAQEEAQRRKSRQVLGQQRAAFAQAGTGLDGSAADVMEQSATMAELDALTMRYEGDLQARGLGNQAKAAKFEGKMAKRNSYFQAAGTLLSGSADYGAYKKSQKPSGTT